MELRQGNKFFRGASAHEVSAYFELIGSVLEEGVAAGLLPRRPAGEGGDQGALRRHGPDGHLVGAGQARLSPRRDGRRGGHDLPQRSHARWRLKRCSSSGRRSFVVITLNRPPANAISETLIRELNAALSSVQTDDGVRVVIITGSGDRIFCGGADLGSAFAGRRRRDVHPLRQQRDAKDGALPQADHRGHQRPRDGRRLRDRHGVPPPPAQGDGAHGPDRVEPRDHPGLRRHAAAAAAHRPHQGAGVPAARHADPGGGVPGARTGQPAVQRRRDAQRRQGPGAAAGQACRRWPPRLIIKAVDEGLESPMARSIDVEIDAFLPT